MTVQTIGLEVELAVYKLKRPVVCDFLPYTKADPLVKKGTLYHKDASMFELAMRPCTDGVQLDSAYAEALAEATAMLPAHAEFECVPCVEYTDEELSKDSYASVLGCGASMNLYDGHVAMPSSYANNKRYAGLHVNMGSYNNLSASSVLAMDATLGLKSVRDWEQDYKDDIQERRSVYGRAGEYRIKDFGDEEIFGLEYRTLPASSWIKTDGTELFSLVNRALALRLKDIAPHAKDIQYAIDNCDSTLANRLINTIHSNTYWTKVRGMI